MRTLTSILITTFSIVAVLFFGTADIVRAESAEGLKFTSPTTYQICIKGFLDESWSDRLSGMLIENQPSGAKTPTAILRGKLLDQTQLLGVLSNLYEMHMSLISEELLDDD